MLGYYLRLAIGGMRRTPWLAALMVLSLAVGIAASMITMTLRHALGLDPIPSKSERLLNLQDPTSPVQVGGMFSYSEAVALSRLGGGSAESVMSGAGIATSLSLMGHTQEIRQGVGIRYTTSAFFRIFDVQLLRGRIWTHEEERDAAPVVVLGEEMARHLFGGDEVVGQRILMGDTAYTVIGVTTPWNPQPRYYDLGSAAGVFGGGGDSIFVPVTTMRYASADLMVSRACPGGDAAMSSPPELLASPCRWLGVWYLARTEHDARALARSLPGESSNIFPDSRASHLRLLDVRQVLEQAAVVPVPVRVYAWLGLAFFALCVVNASGMQLSRVLRTGSQVGIRRALGASRMQIVGQHLCDALLVSGIGGVLGISLTFAGLAAVRRLPDVYYAELARLDGTMFGTMVALVVVCGALVGAIPAWLASRVDPAVLIKVPQ